MRNFGNWGSASLCHAPVAAAAATFGNRAGCCSVVITIIRSEAINLNIQNRTEQNRT